jgi:mannitol/fructose-specific phosphotransferase system IIA component (Ntr-type)
MKVPFPGEPHHGNIDWEEKDNDAHIRKYGIAFEDIQSGFAKPHARLELDGPRDFISLIEVQGIVFEARCRFDFHLTIFAVDVATQDAKDTHNKTLSQSA